MKTATLISGALLSLSAQAGIDTFKGPFPNAGVVPDGNLSGWSDTETVSGSAGNIARLSVTLDLSGGYNGDLYAYLSYDGSQVVLLNRVGVGTGTDLTYSFGYAGAGFNNLVLQDGASNPDIHNYGGGLGTGIYSPDGRDVSPLASPTDLLGASRATLDGTFHGMNPNGQWTLVVADLSAGGGTSQLSSWGLDITTFNVPEPSAMRTGLVMGLAAVGFVWWRRRQPDR